MNIHTYIHTYIGSAVFSSYNEAAKSISGVAVSVPEDRGFETRLKAEFSRRTKEPPAGAKNATFAVQVFSLPDKDVLDSAKR
jgi:hypothetical protein